MDHAMIYKTFQSCLTFKHCNLSRIASVLLGHVLLDVPETITIKTNWSIIFAHPVQRRGLLATTAWTSSPMETLPSRIINWRTPNSGFSSYFSFATLLLSIRYLQASKMRNITSPNKQHEPHLKALLTFEAFSRVPWTWRPHPEWP